MTEQEAETLAVRLTRIWEPVVLSDSPLWGVADEIFSFSCHMVGDFRMWFEQDLKDVQKDMEIRPDYEKHYPEAELQCRFLCIQFDQNTSSISLDNAPLFKEHDLSNFRRNCWLSGFSIEASAHEKAEWVQGFSREELQAWNLKL